MSVRYSLGPGHVLRADPHYRVPFSAYNTRTDATTELSCSSYLLLLLLQINHLSSDDIVSYLNGRGLHIPHKELHSALAEMHKQGILTTEKTINPIPRNLASAIEASPVPVASSPIEAEVHLTAGCNLRCRHCIFEATTSVPNELGSSEWCDIFDQMESLSLRKLILSGGEPLCHPDHASILRHLTRKNIRVELLTNGLLISEDLLDALASPHFSTTVSLDGADSATHETIRGIGTFAGAMRAISSLQSAHATFHIASTIHAQNTTSVRPLVELAARFGARSILLIMLDPYGRAREDRTLHLQAEQRRALSDLASKLRREYDGVVYVGLFDVSQPNMKEFGGVFSHETDHIACGAGTVRLAVNADGGVFPCAYAFGFDEFRIGSAIDAKLYYIWARAQWEPFRGGVLLQDLPECSQCAIAPDCVLKNCRLRTYFCSGDFYGRPPYCQSQA